MVGMIILLTVVLVVLLLGYFLLKINFDELLGIASGATGNPAILAYGNSLAPTGTPDINYAMIFPGRRYDREDHRRAGPGCHIRDRGALAVVVHGCGLQCSVQRTTSAGCSMN
jgi:Predicted Permease Membrane Region